MFEATLFYLFALFAVLGGVLVVVRKNPFESALALVGTFFFLAADYALLGAHFVAAVQILVYAGAIMVLFIFVIMLLNLTGQESHTARRFTVGMAIGGVASFVTGLTILVSTLGAAPAASASAPGFGTVEAIGVALFGGRYLLPFEIASVLLTVAVVGAVVLAKKDLR